MSLEDRFTGRVKWFNNKAGYGFITITDGSKSGSDVFVHHSEINVISEQYKYLVQGEYVNLSLKDAKTENNDFQAGNVCGINGGKLMCESRHDNRVSRLQYREQNNAVQSSEEQLTPKQRIRSTPKDKPGQTQQQGKSEWKQIGKVRESTRNSKQFANNKSKKQQNKD